MQKGRVLDNRIAICPSGPRVVMFHVKAVVDLFLVQHAKGRSTRVGSRPVWYCIAPIDSVAWRSLSHDVSKTSIGCSAIAFRVYCHAQKKSSSSVMEPKPSI